MLPTRFSKTNGNFAKHTRYWGTHITRSGFDEQKLEPHGVCFPEHGLDVAAQERDEGGRAEAGRHEVEERGLRVLVEVHDADGGEEAGDVGQVARPEVEVGAALQAVVVAQQEGHEDACD